MWDYNRDGEIDDRDEREDWSDDVFHAGSYSAHSVFDLLRRVLYTHSCRLGVVS